MRWGRVRQQNIVHRHCAGMLAPKGEDKAAVATMAESHYAAALLRANAPNKTYDRK